MWIHRMLLLSGYSGEQIAYIDGDVTLAMRNEIIDGFSNNARIKVLLITTGVGGYGLNLDIANYLVLFDVDYVPDNDMQAFLRIHRITQRKIPFIFRLMSEGTVDEYVMCRKQDVRLVEQSAVISSFFSAILDEYPQTELFPVDERSLWQQFLDPIPYSWSPFDDFNPGDLQAYFPVLYELREAYPRLVSRFFP